MLMTWDEYRDWETDKDELEKTKERNLLARDKMNKVVNFEENF